VHVDLLGGLDLQGPPDPAARLLLSGRRRIALLVYLGSETDRPRVRRGALARLLWPMASRDRALGSLRQMLRQVRAALGADFLHEDGPRDLTVARHRFSSDVQRFDEIAAGDPAGAIALYHGDLVPGFSVPGARPFDRWLENRRVRLRLTAMDAGWRLAERLRTQGNVREAGRLARWSVALGPPDELEAGRLLEFLVQLGDRAGALAWFDDFARQLRLRWGTSPGPTLASRVATLRTPVPVTLGA
jgi:DNA-binding SARP family transcriptional activator